MIEATERLPWRPSSGLLVALIPLAILLLFGSYVYSEAGIWWWYEWTVNGSYYAHGVFIPFFVAAMIWRDRERLRRLPVERNWWGIAPIVLSILLIVYAHRAEIDSVLSISFMLFLFGGTMIVAGRKLARALAFPILFLVTMIPIFPNQVVGIAAFPIQMASAKLAATLSNLIGFEAVRTGTQIQLDHYNLNVEVACSGFKTLLGLMSFAGAFAYLVEGAVWKRWLLFLLSAPLSIIVNGVRILLVGIVGELHSADAAAAFHDWSGFLVLILGFMILFSGAKWLKCESFFGIPLQDPPARNEGEAAPPNEKPSIDYDALYGLRTQGALARMAPGLGVVALLVAVGAAAKAASPPPKAQKHLIMQPGEVPVTLAGGLWERFGLDERPTKSVRETLKPETYLDRNYSGNGQVTGAVNLFITGGSSRHTFHDPHDCYLGSGYYLTDIGIETIQTAAGPLKVQVSEAQEIKTGEKSLLMFVFVVDGSLVHTIKSVHVKLLQQTFFGSNGRPFYFIRFRQLSNGVDEARKQEMRSFIAALWPEIAGKVMDPAALARLKG